MLSWFLVDCVSRIYICINCFLLCCLGIEPWTFKQKLGDAAFIPVGCPYQVRNLKVREY